jgi:hypothetical protein
MIREESQFVMLSSFKLDNYLTEGYIFHNLPKKRVNNLPEVDSILLRLKNFTDEFSISSGHGQVYTYTQHFPNNNYCKMCWDIDKAKLIVKYKNIPIQKLKVDILASNISEEAIDHSYLGKAFNNNEPIIVAYLHMFKKMVILDGNHRVMSRYINNIKEINAYVLQPKDHYFAMIDDRSRALYLVTAAMRFITDYLVGDIPKKDLMQCISNLDYFYKISAEKEMKDMLSGKQSSDLLRIFEISG